MTTVLSAIAFKELLERALSHAAGKVVQYMTTRQLRKWQKQMEKMKSVEKPKVVPKVREWSETSNITANWNRTLQ